jgi:hypothetical protein
MADERLFTRDELFDEIDRRWSELNAALDALPPDRLTGPRDAAGWTVTDHINHMAAWDEWATHLLQGRPGWEGLGISETLYKEGDEDTTNATIRDNHAGRTPAEARAALGAAHAQLMVLTRPMDDRALATPYRPRTTDDDPARTIPPVSNVLYGTTAEHYAEHLGWLRTLAGE